MPLLQAELQALQSPHPTSPTARRGGGDDAEVLKLRERIKIVEEVLKAMRDEAREHVLSMQPSDLTLDALLGSGSFAEVHSAHWHLPCAVKRLKDSVRGNRYEVNKFQREAYLLRSLLHPGMHRSCPNREEKCVPRAMRTRDVVSYVCRIPQCTPHYPELTFFVLFLGFSCSGC